MPVMPQHPSRAAQSTRRGNRFEGSAADILSHPSRVRNISSSGALPLHFFMGQIEMLQGRHALASVKGEQHIIEYKSGTLALIFFAGSIDKTLMHMSNAATLGQSHYPARRQANKPKLIVSSSLLINSGTTATAPV